MFGALISPTRFAQRVFLIAGLYGLVMIPPQFFVELDTTKWPNPITQPDFYYGFACVALAWQIAFLIIAYDPLRFRPLMLAAVLEKIPFAFFAFGLAAADRTPWFMAIFGGIDLLLGLLFIAAWRRTREKH